MKPQGQVIGPNSAAEIDLAWDMPNTFWDSGLFWDSQTFQAEKLIPIINTVRDAIQGGIV